MKKRFLPNLLTAGRIVCSIGLLFCRVNGLPFDLLYFTAGFTDITDGFLARKRNCANRFGEIFDSIADAFFWTAVLWKTIPLLTFSTALWVWIAAVAALRIGILPLRLRTKRNLTLHTVGNRVMGVLLYAFFLSVGRIDAAVFATVVCAVASLLSVGEIYRILRSERMVSK